MLSIKDANFISEIRDVTQNMYRLGWNERNGGNISVLLREDEIAPYVGLLKKIRKLELSQPYKELAGKYFVVTGTGKYFKNVYFDIEDNLGLIQISQDGTYADLLWGYKDGGTFTSEITMHLGAHLERLRKNSEQRVVVHAHPASVIAMTHVHSWDEKAITNTLWNMITECIVIFPEGVGVLPWMVSSSDDIGRASAEKFREYRILIWALHGIVAAGNSIDEAFGLIETVEKAAEIYMKICGVKHGSGIDKEMLRQVATTFGLEVKPGWLD